MKVNLKNNFTEHLKKVPIINNACNETGISRMTYYRWMKKFKTFKKEVEEAQKIDAELGLKPDEHSIPEQIESQNSNNKNN